MPSDFAATAALDDAALRALLDSARAEERVWAAWRIALRRGTAMPEVVAHVRAGEPSAGVRRAILPVLLGHGELDVLVALARHDPAGDVRAAAMILVVRAAVQGAIPIELVTRAYDGDPDVRLAILGAVAAEAPAPLRELVRRALVDDARPREERLEAFEASLRFAPIAAVRWLGGARGHLAAEAWVRLDALLRAGLALDGEAAVRLDRLRAARAPKPKPVAIK